MTLFKASEFKSLATRESGAIELRRVAQALAVDDLVTIDFEGLAVTPSFADGLLGGLAESLGESQFRIRMVLTGVSPSMRPLINGVIARRLRGIGANHAAA